MIKALKLNPNKNAFQRKQIRRFIDGFGVLARGGNRNKNETGGSELWKRELEKSVKGMFNFTNEKNKVDDVDTDSVFFSA